MTDRSAIYQEVILDHNRKPRNFGVLAESETNRHAEGHNPVCGDHISISLAVADDRIANIAFTGTSCAICKASASLMTGAVKGKTPAEAEAMVQAFRDMATGKLDEAEVKARLGRLTVFAGVRDLPSRVKCAVLPWHTLHAALHSLDAVSTEARNPSA